MLNGDLFNFGGLNIEDTLKVELNENDDVNFVKNEFTWDKTSKGLIDLYNNL